MLDHELKVIFALGRYADLVLLDRRLDLGFEGFDRGDDLFGFLMLDPLPQPDLLTEAIVKSLFGRLEIKGLQGDLTPGHPRLEDILKVPELKFVIGDQPDLGFFFFPEKLDRTFTALEIVTREQFFFCLIDGVIYLLKVDPGNDIERVVLGHRMEEGSAFALRLAQKLLKTLPRRVIELREFDPSIEESLGGFNVAA